MATEKGPRWNNHVTKKASKIDKIAEDITYT